VFISKAADKHTLLMADEIFSTLPASLRRRIDDAFDIAAKGFNGDGDAEPALLSTSEASPTPSLPSMEPAGFIPYETQAGFMLEDSKNLPSNSIIEDESSFMSPSSNPFLIRSPALIPMTHIPTALQLLGLQSNDEESLSVFRKAASGWTHSISHSRPNSQSERELVVSREDWRAVCAVLLEPGSRDGGEGGGLGEGPSDLALHSDMNDESEPDEESDEYQYEDEPFAGESSDEEEDSDEEYTNNRRTKFKSLRNSHVHSLSSSSGQTSRTLTPHQSLECRRAFALFFDVEADSEELEKKKITIKEISSTATLLKEKLRAEEVSIRQ
jgi:hypothetical protein